MDTGSLLVQSGNDLVFDLAVLDEDGNAVTAGQTVEISVYQEGTSKYWNTGTSAFDLGAEPALISATQIGSTGIYRYTLAGGNSATYDRYRIHIDAGGIVAQDFSLSVVVAKAVFDANLVQVNGEATNDGIDWDEFFKLAQAVLYGKAIRSSQNFKYRDQGDSTDLVDYDVSATGRTVNTP